MAATASGQSYVQPRAAWQVTLDGQDLTEKFAPRLISLSLTEARSEQADELSIEIEDHDGALVLPELGAQLTVSLGWERGTGVTPGLVAKGSFAVDEVGWEGPPDTVRIRARSAKFATDFRTRKTKVWHEQTLGAITGKIASDNGLTARCHPDLAGITVTSAEQANQSDMEFLRNLGRRYDAAATVKAGCLIFSPIGSATTATGKTIPEIALTRQSGDRYSYHRAARDSSYKGAEAHHYQQDTAERQLAQDGDAPRRRLKRVYSSESDAKAAAGAEAKRLKRAEAKFELTLAYGNPLIAAGAKASASGFKSEIDGRSWLIATVEHRMDSSGFTTRLEMEVSD